MSTYHANGRAMWSLGTAYHDNGRTAWSLGTAYWDNGRTAYSLGTGYHSNGRSMGMTDFVELPLGDGIRLVCGKAGAQLFVYGQQVVP